VGEGRGGAGEGRLWWAPRVERPWWAPWGWEGMIGCMGLGEHGGHHGAESWGCGGHHGVGRP